MDAVDGASSYKLQWRQPDGVFGDNEAIATETNAGITVKDYGQWEVRLQACNDAGCSPPIAQTVATTLAEPENFTVSATPGSLDLSASWDPVDGASSYKLQWRQPDGAFGDNQVIVTETNAVITVSDYGRWEVRLKACNDAGCGPGVDRTVAATPPGILSIAPVLDDEENLIPRTFEVSWDPVDGASSYNLRWKRAGSDRQPEDELTVRGGDTQTIVTLPEDGKYRVDVESCDDLDACTVGGSSEMEVKSFTPGHLSTHYRDYAYYRKSGYPYYNCQTKTVSVSDAYPVDNGFRVTWEDPGISSITKYQYYAADVRYGSFSGATPKTGRTSPAAAPPPPGTPYPISPTG